jgi:RNA polymerase sigma-70 factor (ECF subfamily)
VPAADDKNKNLHQLVKKAASGDEIAFGEIYDRYFEKIYRFVYFRVSHEQTAEDLAAEVFIKAWKNISSIQSDEAFNGWIYQIARNQVVDHYRTRKITVDIELLANVLEFEDRMIHRANLSFDQKRFLSALPKLSEDQQLIIRLKFIEDLPNEEIAEIMEKPEGTIRVIQHRAIKQLKTLMQNDG